MEFDFGITASQQQRAEDLYFAVESSVAVTNIPGYNGATDEQVCLMGSASLDEIDELLREHEETTAPIPIPAPILKLAESAEVKPPVSPIQELGKSTVLEPPVSQTSRASTPVTTITISEEDDEDFEIRRGRIIRNLLTSDIKVPPRKPDQKTKPKPKRQTTKRKAENAGGSKPKKAKSVKTQTSPSTKVSDDNGDEFAFIQSRMKGYFKPISDRIQMNREKLANKKADVERYKREIAEMEEKIEAAKKKMAQRMVEVNETIASIEEDEGKFKDLRNKLFAEIKFD